MQSKEIKLPDGYYPKVDLLGDRTLFYSTERYETVPYLGTLNYKRGATFPSKGIPQPHVIYAINIVKEVFKQTIRNPFIFVGNSFLPICRKAFSNYIVPDPSLCKTAYMVKLSASLFLQGLGVERVKSYETATYLSQIFEHDDGWRYLLQDMMTELDVYMFSKNPRKEIRRLFSVFKERDEIRVHTKVQKFLAPLLLLLYVPRVRKSVIKASAFFKEMKYDEADYYWASLKMNYKYGGKSYQERAKNMTIPPLYELIGDNVIQIS